MKDFFKKGLLVGLGVAEFTRETLAKAIAELEKKGDVSRAEAKKIMESFSRTVKKRQRELESALGKGFSAVFGKMHIATDDRVRELEKRLRSLEKKLAAKR
jgi:polyhydroxyalkanoate synthesis regulator phasin